MRTNTDLDIQQNRVSNNNYFHPPVNVYKQEACWNIDMALPGYTREEIIINVEDQYLIIESKVEPTSGGNYIKREIPKGTFNKRFSLPAKTDVNQISARWDNGVLRINIPQMETPIHKINIQ